jgi:hypothetical protein
MRIYTKWIYPGYETGENIIENYNDYRFGKSTYFRMNNGLDVD